MAFSSTSTPSNDTKAVLAPTNTLELERAQIRIQLLEHQVVVYQRIAETFFRHKHKQSLCVTSLVDVIDKLIGYCDPSLTTPVREALAASESEMLRCETELRRQHLLPFPCVTDEQAHVSWAFLSGLAATSSNTTAPATSNTTTTSPVAIIPATTATTTSDIIAHPSSCASVSLVNFHN